MNANTVAHPGVLPTAKTQSTPSSIASDLEGRTEKNSDGRYVFPAGRGLADIERQRIGVAIAELRNRLLDRIPSNGGPSVRETIETLYACFKTRDISHSRQEFYQGFVMALASECRPAMFEAGRRLIRAQAPPEYSTTFLPSAADFVTYVRTIEQGWKTDIARLERLLAMGEALPAIAERQASPEEVDAARARFDKMAASVKRTSTSGGTGPWEGPSPAAKVAAETAARKAARRPEDQRSEGDV